MENYKLFYFPSRGRADPARQLFKLAGVKFEDVRVTMDEWAKYKLEMPFGQMPVLEVDGVKIAQTTAILRFLGQKFNMAGKGPLENARLDMIAEGVQEMTNTPGYCNWSAVLFGLIPEDKVKYFEEKVVPSTKPTADIVEKILKENGNGLLVGDKETWVDIFVAEMFSRVIDFGRKDALADYPEILRLIHRIHDIPAIKTHFAEMPAVPC